MQIITCEDIDFPQLLTAIESGKVVGTYWKNGEACLVCATTNLLIVTRREAPQRIGIEPTRNLEEAQKLALQLLEREQSLGREVEFKTNLS